MAWLVNLVREDDDWQGDCWAENPTSGKILFDGQDVTKIKQKHALQQRCTNGVSR